MLACSECSHANPRASKFCEACGASLAEVAAAERFADETEAEAMLIEVKKAQSALMLVAVVQLISTVFLVMTGALDAITMVVMLGVGGLYFGLWVWCKHNPLAASIVGLVVFVTLHAAEALVDPSTIVRGIVVKVIVIAVLIRAIGNGVKHREFVRERGLG
ncbi:MAG: zinc ribbon domain-containing protein [Enhygromyxa sp.]